MYFQLGLAEPDVIAVFYYPDYGDLMSNISNNISPCAFCLNQTCNMHLTLRTRTLHFSVCMKANLYGTFVCNLLRSCIHLLLYNY